MGDVFQIINIQLKGTFWNLMYSMVIAVNNNVYLKFAKRINLFSPQANTPPPTHTHTQMDVR